MKITTTFSRADPLMIGIGRDVQVEFDEPIHDGTAWKVSYRLTGSKNSFERHCYGETPLQALFLAVQFIRRLYEPGQATE